MMTLFHVTNRQEIEDSTRFDLLMDSIKRRNAHFICSVANAERILYTDWL